MKNTDLSVQILLQRCLTEIMEDISTGKLVYSIKLLCLLSTLLILTENSRIQGLFKAFEGFSSTFQGRHNFQGLFKKAF